jgi:hypothetical protein
MRSGHFPTSLLIFFSSVLAFAGPKPPAAAVNPPRIVLTLTAPSVNAWKLRIENTGEVPLRLVADARLLSLEITPPSGKHVLCVLPNDARPASDAAGAIVFFPKTAFVASIDPRFYCMHHLESLVVGSKVVAHFGWTAGRTVTAPFVVAPILEGSTSAAAASDSPVSPAKEVVGALITLDEDGIPKAPPTVSRPSADARLDLALSRRLDAARPEDLTATISVTNTGVRAVTFLFRPQTLGFDVIGPTGTATRCGGAGESAGIREFFTTLAPKAKTSITILPSALCPSGTFDRPGVYEVRPRLDTRLASGKSVGLHTFDDLVVGPPSLVRIRSSRPNTPQPSPTVE